MELNMKPIGCKYTCNQLASQNLFFNRDWKAGVEPFLQKHQSPEKSGKMTQKCHFFHK